ncbi:uncharacterized protein LOC116213717 [Punica granatum]|uniref:Uncharacterized protein LOC116213717 n=1 Tax=Punica granatum TaxID=22663 RepID=A0A6P8EC10_PUNGR|nr:uncharacterized protein LOC116213717 [Punica granatum]
MKGQGRQQGTVRTCLVLPVPSSPLEGSQPAHRLDSLPAVGSYAKVRSKPVNHSKFTGKCGKAQCTECQMGPVQKSKDKTKGSRKLELNNAVSSHRLITWQVVHGRTGSNFVGLSASGLLDHLAHESDDSDESYDSRI